MMFLKDLLFPKICLGCLWLGAYICPSCQKKLTYVEKESCFFCKKPSPFGLTHISCQKKYYPDGVMAIFYYNHLFKKIIKATKYQFATEVLKELSQIVNSQRIEKLSFLADLKNAVFQAIPLHPKKEKQRGFNQAKILISFFQKFLPFTEVDYLIRQKETRSQAEIKDTKKRYLNIKGAFSINPHGGFKKEKIVVLVDDVVTSGMTILEATKTLKKAGVNKVFVLALSKA